MSVSRMLITGTVSRFPRRVLKPKWFRRGRSRAGVEWAGDSTPGCWPARPLPELCPPGLGLSPPHRLLLPPAVWSSYWITVQTPPCGTGRATQLCTMQPPMATDRTSNWYVWDPALDSAPLCLWVLKPRVTESNVVSRSGLRGLLLEGDRANILGFPKP